MSAAVDSSSRSVLISGGRVVRTIVRGSTVYCKGEITASAGHGRFLSSQDEHRLRPLGAPTAELAR